MPKTLHLYASDSDLTKIAGTVGLLCEFAPDSPWLRGAEQCFGPEEMLGSADEALRIAYSLASKLVESTPVIEGLPVLRVFEEPLLEQLSYLVQALHLDRWISSHGFTSCRFSSYSPWLDRLRQIRAVSGSDYEFRSDVPLLQSNPYSRAAHRIWNSRPAPAEFLRRVAPLWSRCLSAVPQRSPAKNAPKGGIWFYSNAYNYTKIGLEYEAYLPEKLNFLVEDSATGGKRLHELGRDFHLLYGWSRSSDIPSGSEVRAVGAKITAAAAAVPLSEEQNRLRSLLLKSEWWRFFQTRYLPFALFNTRALRRWCEAVSPEMIVVGNAGDERHLLLQECVKQIPSVMLQHGIMHWVYGVADQPVDAFLVRGPFFQRCMNEKLRRKTVVGNSPEAREPASDLAGKARDSILFITTPYNVPVLFHQGDLRDMLRSLLRVAHSSRRRLLIRVHPLEKISAYQQTILELEHELGWKADVDYSQGPGVEEVLEQSCVAILHFSTMFLDCLRHGIPIVSFDWHWFPNKRQFEAEGIFNLASDLHSFEALVQQGIDGALPRRRSELQDFLAPSQPHELESFFRDIWERRSAAKGLQPLARI